MAAACPTCHGEGEMITKPCSPCKGKGKTLEAKKVSVKIPAGVDQGVRLRVTGEGQGGSRGGPNGDLFVFLQVKESEYFDRDGSDIVYNATVSMTQAALGCAMKIPTLGGDPIDVQVPAGAQHGHRITVAGEGIPRLRGVGRGDLYVDLGVSIPTKLNKEQKELLQKLAELSGENAHGKESGFFNKIFGD